MKFLCRDERNNGALESDHAADAGIDEDEQRELRPILANAKPVFAARDRRAMHSASVRGANPFVQ